MHTLNININIFPLNNNKKEIKIYGKQNYDEIDYTLKASKFFIKGYPRILSSINNLWKNLYRQIFTAILLERNLNF